MFCTNICRKLDRTITIHIYSSVQNLQVPQNGAFFFQPLAPLWEIRWGTHSLQNKWENIVINLREKKSIAVALFPPCGSGEDSKFGRGGELPFGWGGGGESNFEFFPQ